MQMTPLPGALAPGSPLLAWRLDSLVQSPTWDSGLGAQRYGGRWNSKGTRVVYCSLDPATAILEVAVHRGFEVLDTKPFVLTCMAVARAEDVKVVAPQDIPNPAWLHPGIPSTGQQALGDELLAYHPFIALPSVVSKSSWNLIFQPDVAAQRYALLEQERLAIDGRLHPPKG